MRLPVIEGLIRRRILVNFRIDPEVMQSQLPSRFKPKLHKGKAVAGICLIRLEHIRPRFLPAAVGVSSENAAHRIAVNWMDDAGAQKEGVFIPRRDTGSLLNHLLGGRLFPGEHHLADFQVSDGNGSIDLKMKSRDQQVELRVRGEVVSSLPPTSGFRSLAEASDFFEPGSMGFSVTKTQNRLDGLSLKTKTWNVEPLAASEVYSSYFANERLFPKGSVEFDCALLMQNIAHEWRSEPDLYI